MRTRLLVLALLLIILSACGGVAPNPNNGGSSETSLLSNSMIQTLRIETDYPAQMQVNHSYLIRVLLVPSGKQTLKSIISVEQATQVATNPTPVGTPGATVLNAFGKGYEPYATAALAASSYNVVSNPPEEQSLTQTYVEWNWDVTPLSAGQQSIFVDVWIQWLPINPGNSTLPPPTYRIGENQLAIQVAGIPPPFQPLIDWNGVITAVVSALLISLLSWFGIQITRQIRRRAKQRSTIPRPVRTSSGKKARPESSHPS